MTQSMVNDNEMDLQIEDRSAGITPVLIIVLIVALVHL